MIPFVTIIPSKLSSLPLDERRDLPDTAAIYFVLAGDTVLYIGQSRSLRQRWVAHHRLKQLNEYGACRIAWMTVDDAGLLNEMERACIAHFNPILNNEPLPNGARAHAADEAWVAVRVPEGVKEYAEEQARQEERSVSYVVRRLIVERVEQLEREQKQGCRALEPDEQARRKTCPHCGDTHAALIDALTGATQCRACGKTFFTATTPRLERERGCRS